MKHIFMRLFRHFVYSFKFRKRDAPPILFYPTSFKFANTIDSKEKAEYLILELKNPQLHYATRSTQMLTILLHLP